MALTKEQRTELERLQALEAEPPERRESIGVNFTYDPDDAESVKRGFSRGHLTRDDLEGWGYDLAKLGLKVDGTGKDDDDVKGDDAGAGGPAPKRRGYFEA